MGIKWRGIDRHDILHPNRRIFSFMMTPGDTDGYVTAVAENTLTAGDDLTLAATYQHPTSGAVILPSQAQSVVVTPSAAVTIVLDVYGYDQFGDPIKERLTVAAANVYGLKAFSVVTRINVVSTGASANTIQIGWPASATNTRIGLPIRFRVNSGFAAGSGPHDAELLYVVRDNGTTKNLQDIDGMDEGNATIRMGAGFAHQLLYHCMFDLKTLGARS